MEMIGWKISQSFSECVCVGVGGREICSSPASESIIMSSSIGVNAIEISHKSTVILSSHNFLSTQKHNKSERIDVDKKKSFDNLQSPEWMGSDW